MLTRFSRSSTQPSAAEAELVAYCIIERPDCPPAWTRCGRARLNRDGSVNVQLDALPLSGELHLRPSAARAPQSAAQKPPLQRRETSLHLNA